MDNFILYTNNYFFCGKNIPLLNKFILLKEFPFLKSKSALKFLLKLIDKSFKLSRKDSSLIFELVFKFWNKSLSQSPIPNPHIKKYIFF